MNIQSIRETLKGGYVKPSPDKIKTLCESHTDESLEYLKKRGLTTETIEYFKLGYDKEKNAISIPIMKENEVVNIKYRFITPRDIKYTQEKGCEVWLFNEDGLFHGKKKGGVLIVEGEFDCMMAWQEGFKNTISPASGKDSYGVWIELLDSIKRVFIAYDNDKPGRQASKDLAERVGVDKSWDIIYPEGVKDANEFFLEHTSEDFRDLIKQARPFYKYKFQGVVDIIESLREHKEETIQLDCVPFIKFESDWMVILSGQSNVGKTAYSLNIANELANKNIPCLFMPFERGIKSVGRRFLDVRFQLSNNEIDFYKDEDWDKMVSDVIELPLFFSLPSPQELEDTVRRAKRLFNIKFVIVDHLDYMIRRTGENENSEVSRALQAFKALAQELGVIFIIVHHIRKPQAGTRPTRPRMEDLKGSSSVYQDPEAVIMLSSEEDGELDVSIVKNKGEMGEVKFEFISSTGRIKKKEVDWGDW